MKEDNIPIGSIVQFSLNTIKKNNLKNYFLCDGSSVDSRGLDLDLVQYLKQYSSPDEVDRGVLRLPNLTGTNSENVVDSLRYFIKLRDYKPSSVNFILSSTDD
jgi:hypothetical protein